MSTVRNIEVKLASLEDRILGGLGYREFTVSVNGTILNPVPQVKQITTTDYASRDLAEAFDKIVGGNGSPRGFYQLFISRDIPEDLLRSFNYWTLSRGSYTATCLVINYKILDSRILVNLGITKVENV